MRFILVCDVCVFTICLCQSLSATFSSHTSMRRSTNLKHIRNFYRLIFHSVSSHLVQPVTMWRLWRCAGDRKTLLICLPVNTWMGIRDVFSPGFFSTGPQMTWTHAESFRRAFILICTSRGWNGAGLVSLHRSPRGPIRAPLQSRDETPQRWFTIQRLFIACG